MLAKNAGTYRAVSQILCAYNTKNIEIRTGFCMARHFVHTFVDFKLLNWKLLINQSITSSYKTVSQAYCITALQ